MAKVELIMPKMGESIMEATILNWVKNVGDQVEAEETILEIATDKVDSEIPSPVDGTIAEILFPADTVVEVGKTIAILETEGIAEATTDFASDHEESKENGNGKSQEEYIEREPAKIAASVPFTQETNDQKEIPSTDGERFYSPLVRNIAKKEGIPLTELHTIAGTGANGRVTKRDILSYLESRSTESIITKEPIESGPITTVPSETASTPPQPALKKPADIPAFTSGEDEIIQMDRMRKLIADHMVNSKRTSPHVTSFVEADVTRIVKWRDEIKTSYQKQYGEKITYTPIFIEAVIQAIKDFPMINISVDEDKIIHKKNINIGMATALPNGNLIVPVIKNADYLNLAGLTSQVNDLANRARNHQLKPEEISGGTFTITNVGTFGNVMGTPIINQPQVAILATGAIKKKPVVVETEDGDTIAIRSMMFLSLSYDHRVVDGFLGGSFLRRIADYLEGFDRHRSI